MDRLNGVARAETPAQAQGMTEELGRAMVRLAADELDAGRVEAARSILEGLVVTNPHDHAPWALLAAVEKRRGCSLAARVCAAIAYELAPEDPQVQLAYAEALLGDAEERPAARARLAVLGEALGVVGDRARALLTALGP
jgi:cytochrome c-type biogenesis protein CcmH/NrfG